MRTPLLTALLFGAITMSDVATAEDKKQELKEKTIDGIKYNERVTVKSFVEQGKDSGFLKPAEGVWAVRREFKDAQDGGKMKLSFRIHWGGSPNAKLTRKTVIIDAAGNEYECVEVMGDENALVKQTKKAGPEKKSQ
jgi:hypothetical protein